MARRRTFGYVRRLPSGRWQASYLDEPTRDRVVAPSTFATKTDANLWLASVETDMVRGDHLRPELARRPFAEWAEEWLHSLHVKPKTYVGYESSLRNHVLPVFANRPIADISYRECKAFVDRLLRDGLAPGTVGEARKILRLVLGEALRSDAIRRNPADGLRIPRGTRQEMVFLTPAQVMRLADEIANPPRPRSHPRKSWPAYGLLVRLAAWSGLRAGEMAALRVGRFDHRAGRLEVAESVQEIHGALIYGPPKTYARRGVDLPEELASELADHLDGRASHRDALIFTAPGGGPLRHHNFYKRLFKPAVLRADLDRRTRFHDLRHTAAALMIAEGAHLLAVKERLGHSTIQVTADRYGHLFPSLEEALTSRLSATYRAAVNDAPSVVPNGHEAHTVVSAVHTDASSLPGAS